MVHRFAGCLTFISITEINENWLDICFFGFHIAKVMIYIVTVPLLRLTKVAICGAVSSEEKTYVANWMIMFTTKIGSYGQGMHQHSSRYLLRLAI